MKLIFNLILEEECSLAVSEGDNEIRDGSGGQTKSPTLRRSEQSKTN